MNKKYFAVTAIAAVISIALSRGISQWGYELFWEGHVTQTVNKVLDERGVRNEM